MGIKVGDKVRVSKDAPRIYTPDWVDEMFNLVLKVTKVEDGNAMVVFAERTSYKTVLTAIPTKYLIKVDAEAKEPKYHKGDRVKVCSKNADRFGCVGTILEVHDNGTVDVDFNDYYVGGHLYSIDFIEPYTEPTAPTIKVGDKVQYLPNNTCGIISKCANNHCVIEFNDGLCCCAALENVEPVQTKEQMEANANDAAKHCDIPNLSELDRIKVREFIEIHPFDFESLKCGGKVFEDMYWDAYTADLAKEIALKVANKYNDPKETADYAVSVAKAVVENLKKK